jgi:hypothetical protein
MKELLPKHREILKSLTDQCPGWDGLVGKVHRAYRCMPNTRPFGVFGEPNPEWSLEVLESMGLAEATPLQNTSELEWTITPKGAAAIGKSW